jgi:hypothetical protein
MMFLQKCTLERYDTKPFLVSTFLERCRKRCSGHVDKKGDEETFQCPLCL